MSNLNSPRLRAIQLLRRDWQDHYKRSSPWVVWLILLCDFGIVWLVTYLNQTMWPGEAMDAIAYATRVIGALAMIFLGMHALDPDLETRTGVTKVAIAVIIIGLANLGIHTALAREVGAAEVRTAEDRQREAFQTEQDEKRMKARAEADKAAADRARAEAAAAQRRKEEEEAKAKAERGRRWRMVTYQVAGTPAGGMIFGFIIAAVDKTVKAAESAHQTAADILEDRKRFWLALGSAISEAGVLLIGMAYVWHKRTQDSDGNNIADRLQRIFQTNPERVRQEDPEAYAVLCEVYGAPKNAPSR